MSAEEPRFRDSYFVVRDGLRLHYRDYPGSADRPPLLCLHGLTRNVRDFAAFAEHHSPRFRVIALDFRGRGMSDNDPLPARYNALAYAGDVIELLDQLGIAEAIFVGTSLGGLVTLAIAAIAPQRVAAAILNDVGPELGEVGLDHIRKYVGRGERFASWDDAAETIARNQQVAFPKYRAADWLDAARRHCREAEGEIAFDYDPAIADAFKVAEATPRVDMWPLFAALARKPLLVIRGGLSELLRPETLERMHAAAPDMKSVTVPDVGHAPMLDEPEVAAAIDSFLDAHPD